MRSLARTLLVVLGLVVSLREAGSAACASTCDGRPLEGATTCAPRDCAPRPCCAPCGEPALPCPLLEPTPEAVLERAPVARALPEPVAFPFAAALPLDLPALDAAHDACRSAAQAGRSIRPRAGPLWLVDLRFLI